MIYSMTAFGRSHTRSDWGTAVWELRSINHRYLEINVRLPESLRDLEQNVRERVQCFFHRGKIECSLRFQPGPKLGSLLSVNDNLLNQLINLAKNINTQFPEKIARLNVIDFLSWEGVVIEEVFKVTDIKEELLASFNLAATDLKEGRSREGKILAEAIEERLVNIAATLTEIKVQSPKLIERQRQKILQRLEEAKLSLDIQRLEQEMVYFSQKVDITEEIDRTFSHLTEVKRALEQSDAAGRRLDFMMQELNREANTIASKSVDATVTHAAVEIKVLIEQIREQVQNIE